MLAAVLVNWWREEEREKKKRKNKSKSKRRSKRKRKRKRREKIKIRGRNEREKRREEREEREQERECAKLHHTPHMHAPPQHNTPHTRQRTVILRVSSSREKWMLGYVHSGQPTVILRVFYECLDMCSPVNRPWSRECLRQEKSECLDMCTAGKQPWSWEFFMNAWMCAHQSTDRDLESVFVKRKVNAWICAQRATDRDLESFLWMLGYVLTSQPTVISRVSSTWMLGYVLVKQPTVILRRKSECLNMCTQLHTALFY